MEESYQAEENKQPEAFEENSAVHTTALLQAAAPFFDKRTQQSLHLITQITGLLSTVQNIGRNNISALSLSFQNVDIEGLLRAIRPHCTLNEVGLVDRVLNIFGIKRVYDTYQNVSSSMPFGSGTGSSGFNPDMIMNMAKAFGGDNSNSASPFGNMNPEMLQGLFRYMNNGNAQNTTQNTTSGDASNASQNTQTPGPETNAPGQNAYYTNYYNSPNRTESGDAPANANAGYYAQNPNAYGQNPAYHSDNAGYYNPAGNYGYPGSYPAGDYNGYPYYNANPGNDYINPDTWKNYDASNYTVNAASLGPRRNSYSRFTSPSPKPVKKETDWDTEEREFSFETQEKAEDMPAQNIEAEQDTQQMDSQEADWADETSIDANLSEADSVDLDTETKEETPPPLSFQTNKNRYMLNSPPYKEAAKAPEVSAASFSASQATSSPSRGQQHAQDFRRHNNFGNPFGRRNNSMQGPPNQAARKSAPSYSPSEASGADQTKESPRKPPSPELVNMLSSMLSPEQKETFDSMRKLFDTKPASKKPNS